MMEPTKFTEEEREDLPFHTMIRLAENQPEYKPLEVVMGPPFKYRMISKWVLTDDERAKLIAGESLYIEQLTFGNLFQPVLPTVGLRDYCALDDF